jgi:streptomycin 6-kinase
MTSAPELDPAGLAALGVDDRVIATRVQLDGQRALRFLADLPRLVACWQTRLDLHGARIMPGGVLSAALACERRRDGAPVVLKLSASGPGGARAEAAALSVWEGVGACRLLFASEDGAAMLLSAIYPGAAVAPGDDDRHDAKRAAELLATLHRIPASRIAADIPAVAHELRWRFERAHDHLDGPSHAGGLVSHQELDDAHRSALSLAKRCPSKVMCHGDFMNKNILLDAVGRWWAIDPRPCVGDPCLDAAFWSLTHRPGILVRERCEEIGGAARLDPGRIWAWAQVFAASEAVLVTDLARARAHHSVLAR